MTSCVQLRGVSKWVMTGTTRSDILRDINLDVRQGEFMAIMGASGSGKSTLLNLIGLLDLPSAGTVSLMNQPVSSLSEDAIALLRARSIGFIFQSFNLIPYLTAKANVGLGHLYAQRELSASRVDKLLSDVRLEHRKSAYPATLSGGERQRVAIARALVNAPSLILADEPTGALDSHTGQEILGILKDLNRSGTTVILVTHDESIARQAQRVLRMRDGRILS